MSVPLLSELREPPVVGQFYLVPTVRYTYFGRDDDWPVIGPRHHDHDLQFTHLHFHLDFRFLSRRQMEWLPRPSESEETRVNGSVLVDREDGWKGAPPVPPILRRLRCRRSTYSFNDRSKTLLAKRVGGDPLTERFGDAAEPIRLRDGRLLCPHRKVDLSQFPRDADGIVTCPLHGLRVRCGVPA